LGDQKKHSQGEIHEFEASEITPKIGARQKLRIYGQKWCLSTPFDP
jgi:hypothetical protein